MLVNIYSKVPKVKGETAVYQKRYRQLISLAIPLFTLFGGVFESPYLFLSNIIKKLFSKYPITSLSSFQEVVLVSNSFERQ